MPTVSVETGGRLHVGFCNLSLARERLYGGIGIGLERPVTVVRAEPAETITVDDGEAREYVERSVELLDLPGAAVSIEESLPRHVGLGSGTQLALAVLQAVAAAHERSVSVRELAPRLGRGGRSGVGVATFEDGGFVVDAGHPTTAFTAAPPARGDWSVPPVVATHDLPTDWRFVLVIPSESKGRSGPLEAESMRAVIEGADTRIADEIAGILVDRLLPAAAAGDIEAFGAAVSAIDRRNGAWYADQQGGTYRPPAGTIVSALRAEPSVFGTGQSSWGPTVYALTTRDRLDAVTAVASDALAATDHEGRVLTTPIADGGASTTRA